MQKAEFVSVKIILGKAGKGEYLDSASPLIFLWLCVKASVMPLETQDLLRLYHAGKFLPPQIWIKNNHH